MKLKILNYNIEIKKTQEEKKLGGRIMFGRYSALEVATYIVNYVWHQTNETITNLQLQKILYYLQGFYLSNNNECLFDDDIIAWQFGPVIPEVYRTFSLFGSSCINPEFIQLDMENIDPEDRAVINRIVNLKLAVNPWELVNETHEERPWVEATENGRYLNNEIGKEVIRNFFTHHPEKFN